MTLERAFAELRPAMFALAYRITGSRADADDIVQEAFLRLHRAEPEEAVRSLTAYLATITARLSLNCPARRARLPRGLGARMVARTGSHRGRTRGARGGCLLRATRGARTSFAAGTRRLRVAERLRSHPEEISYGQKTETTENMVSYAPPV